MEEFFKESEFQHIGIIGNTGSGKSTLIYEKLLQDKHYFKHKFDRVYLWIPSYESNKHYIDKLHLEDVLNRKKEDDITASIMRGDYDKLLIDEYKMWMKKENNLIQDIDINIWFNKLEKKKKEVILDHIKRIHNFIDIDDDTRIFKKYDGNEVKRLFDMKLKYYDEKWLFIFDDCAFDSDFTNDTNYKELLMNGRSRGLSSITLTQKLTLIKTNTRSQFTCLILFFNSQPREVNACYELFSSYSSSEKDFKNRVLDIMDNAPEYSFFFVILRNKKRNEKVYLNYNNEPLLL